MKKLSALFLLFFPVLAFAVSPSVVIQSLSPGATVYSGNAVYFNAIASDFNGSVTYTLSDSFNGSITNSNINSGGVFAWVPTSSDAGSHTITVTVTDGAGNTSSANVYITVMGPATVAIQNLYPSSSVNVGQTVFWNMSYTGMISPTFTVSDSFVGSLLSSNINSSGGFSWTPKNQDIGSHSITVTGSDSSGRTASVTQSINVSIATATIQSLSPSRNIVPKQNVTFTVVPSGFTNPVYSVSDSIAGSGISNSNINSNGVFNWTPAVNQIGTHNITVNISDSLGNTSSISEQIIVSSASVSLTSPSPSSSVNAGSTLTFSATTTGFTNPTYTVSDSFGYSSVGNANITSGGLFSWVPTATDVGTHTITIRAYDNSGNDSRTSVIINVLGQSTPVSNTVTQNTSSASGFNFTKLLSVGSTGQEVTELQKILISKGFLSGVPTGYFGNLTADAVKKFQGANGVSAVGYVGPGTRSLLNGAGVSTNTSSNSAVKFLFTKALALGSTGQEVTELQNKLSSLGFYSGPITGTFGPLTQSAVKKYQANKGLSPVGNVGPATRALLNN